MMKLLKPAENWPMLRKKIEELKSSDESPAIRYKAFLTAAVLDHPEMINQFEAGDTDHVDGFFAVLDSMSYRTALNSK